MAVVHAGFLEAVKVQYQADKLNMELGDMHLVASLLKLSSASVFTIVLHRFVTLYVTE